MKKDEIIKKLKSELNEDRFVHTLGVAYTASCLAMRYQVDMDKAFLAGLLHDCAKGMSGKEILKYCEKNHIELKSIEKENTSLIHAKAGAYMAKNRYGIDDVEILNAILYHTTGRADMTKLEAIIFIADYIEPKRSMDSDLEAIRREAFSDLRMCIRHIYKNTLIHLNKQEKPIDKTTEEAYEYYNESN